MPAKLWSVLFADSTGMVIGTLLIVVLAIAMIVKGASGIQNQSIRLKYGIELKGPKAVGYGWFFVIAGIAIIVIAIVVAIYGPLLP